MANIPIPIYPIQGSVVVGYSTYFVTKDTKSLSKYSFGIDAMEIVTE
jgi:hypothetical protein